MKQVIIIGAVSKNGVYGEGGTIPWHSKKDMKHFKEVTLGHTVVMGRGTWESLPQQFKPLPDRENIIITNTPSFVAEGACVVKSIAQAISIATTQKVFFIGGADIWFGAMNLADEAYITVVEKEYPMTQGVTRLAKELLRPNVNWPDLVLVESVHDVEVTPDGGELGLMFHHWKR